MFHSGIAVARLLIVWGGLFGAPGKPGSDEREWAKLVLPKPYLVLVKGIVVEMTVTEDPNKTSADWKATVQVAHVFCGPQTLRGTTFVTADSTRGLRGDPRMISVLRAGEALWLIEYNPKSGLVPRTRGMVNLPWPVGKSLDAEDYRAAQAVARAVEEVVHAKTLSDAVRLLRKYATDRTGEVSAWAIEVLARLAPKDPQITPFLRQLVDQEGLTIAGQVALDEALIQVARNDWQHSAERWRLLQTWVKRTLGPKDSRWVMQRLDWLAQSRETRGIAQERIVALVKMAALNPGISLEERRVIGATIHWIVRNYPDPKPAFELAMDMVRHSKEPDIRRMGAGILEFIPLDEPCRKTARTLADSLEDEQIARELREALEKAPRRD